MGNFLLLIQVFFSKRWRWATFASLSLALLLLFSFSFASLFLVCFFRSFLSVDWEKSLVAVSLCSLAHFYSFTLSLSLRLYQHTSLFILSFVCHLPFTLCFHFSSTPPCKPKQRQIDSRKMKCRWQTTVEYHLWQLPLAMFLLHIIYTLALAISLVLAILVLALVWLFHFCGMSYG